MKIKKYDSINVIPFIDVLLVLLAIVLLTSTFIQKGLIPVSLPDASSSNEVVIKKELVFVVNKQGEIYLDKKKIVLKDIESILQKYKKTHPILINQDKESSFEIFVNILNILKQNSYNNVSIVTKK